MFPRPDLELPDEVRLHLQRQASTALKRGNQAMRRRRRRDYDTGLLRHRRPAPRWRKWVHSSLLVLLTIALATSTFSYVLVRDLDTRIAARKIDISQLQEEPREIVDDYSGRALNILVIGSDTRDGEGNAAYGDEDEEIGMRSDVTIVVHVSADRTRLQLVSIPRDTMVDMPSCRRSDGTETYAGYRQFNAAFAYGAGEEQDLAGAVNCTRKTVEAVTELVIDEFVVVDFSGFAQLVDALGGVEFCSEEEIEDELADLKLAEGCQHINGQTALGVARSRHSTEDGSDLSRIERQQLLMTQIVKTALNKSILTDLPTLYSFLQEGIASVQTSTALSRLSTAAGLANSIRGIPLEDYQFVTMPWALDPEDPNRVVMTEDAARVWRALKYDIPLPEGIVVSNADGEKGIVGPGGTIVSETETPTAETDMDEESESLN